MSCNNNNDCSKKTVIIGIIITCIIVFMLGFFLGYIIK